MYEGESSLFTGAIYEVVYFSSGTIAEDEYVPLNRLDSRPLLYDARHLRADAFSQIVA